MLILALLSTRPLLDLQMVSEKLCWNVLVLLGGGFAIAAACQVSIFQIFDFMLNVAKYSFGC